MGGPGTTGEQRGERSGDSEGRGAAPASVLLVMIVPNKSVLDDIVTGLLDLGVAGTLVESKGLMALVREEMPVFSGLAALIGEQTASRVVLSVTTEKLAAEVFAFLEAEVSQPDRPIAVTVPASNVLGLRR
jgi:hypothetical protein